MINERHALLHVSRGDCSDRSVSCYKTHLSHGAEESDGNAMEILQILQMRAAHANLTYELEMLHKR